MDITPAEALKLLKHISCSIRIPTATWLLSDVFGILDCTARELLGQLIDAGKLICESGGWLRVVQEVKDEH